MRAYHNTREETYRRPFGAVRVGGAIYLCLDIWDEPDVSCVCRFWVDGEGESMMDMTREDLTDRVRFSCRFKRDTPCIVWYSFIIKHADGTAVRYGAKDGATGGEGLLREWEPPSFQITVYRERKLPEWYRGGLVYQIFPDRFARGSDWHELAENSVKEKRYGPPRAICEDWSKTPKYQKSANGRIVRWDFYGGTLSGIESKLPYLKELGVTVLYLNPIFVAASNHRYDTADYMHVADMLGGDEAFDSLCKAAEACGISIILDGVFNHTGCDSKYFNKYGNFDTVGAYQSPDSPYRDWYRFDDSAAGYRSWWGVDDMPEVEEASESYREFIFDGEDSVVRHWLKAGAKGWRLDVADEMPDDFLAGIKSAALKERDDALVIGEVWEDASNKVSYGKLRKYLLGDELDSVMNYPLRKSLLSYLIGKASAADLAETVTSLYENYPSEAFYGALNLMGSHDKTRVATILGGGPLDYELTSEEKYKAKLTDAQRGMAKCRSWLLVLAQMLLPGVPCIYYGDEVGMEGYTDPYNRGPYPWGHGDDDMMNIYRNAISLRKLLISDDDSDFTAFSQGDDVFGFTRQFANESLTVLLNRSPSASYDVTVPALGSHVADVVGGAEIRSENGEATLKLYPMGSAVLRFTDGQTFGKRMERGSGVLCHITSVPNHSGSGNIGEPAKRFIDFLAASGQKYWQILPVNPTDSYNSPYAGTSAFAANIKLLPESEEELAELFRTFVPTQGYRKFCQDNEWLTPYATFTALRKKFGVAWTKWPDKYAKYSPDIQLPEDVQETAEYLKFCQYRFDVEWRELRRYAKSRNIQIIGDMPMYVSLDSADVWAAPELFTVDKDGRKTLQSGVPPDYFAKDGQLWGNPLYNWDAMRDTGYDWWMRRFKRMFSLYDYVRLDHFRGFEAYWAVPDGKLASSGSWRFGPGGELFRAAYKKFGPLPIVAEDLGTITPPVRALLEFCGMPGTDVLQFADGDPLISYTPPIGKIAYSGTHDNQTLFGWCKARYGADNAKENTEKLLENLFKSRADIVITALQDALMLDDEARMNVPGVASGNWSWQATGERFIDAAVRLLSLTKDTERI